MKKSLILALCSLSACTAGRARPPKVEPAFSFERIKHSLVHVYVEDLRLGAIASGTGTVIRLASGDVGVLTNAHICLHANTGGRAKGLFEDKARALRVLKQDVLTDLCVLSFFHVSDMHPAAVIPMLPKRPARTGDMLFTSGFPLGVPEPTEVVGVWGAPVSLLMPVSPGLSGRCPKGTKKQYGTCTVQMGFVLTTLPTFHGQSGSPVFNKEHELIGVISVSTEPHGQGGIIPIETIVSFLRQ